MANPKITNLKIEMERLGIKAADLKELLGVTPQRISALINADRISESNARRISETYGISLTKLIFNGIVDDFDDIVGRQTNVSPKPFDDYMEVEYVRQSTVAGKVGVESISELPKHRRMLVPKEFETGNYIVVRVDGDSMDDGSKISIPDGSDILVRQYFLQQGEKLPIRNNLFVIVTTTGTVFKQIREHNLEENYIVCHSYNPEYQDYKIDCEDILQIFIYRKVVNSRPPIPEL